MSRVTVFIGIGAAVCLWALPPTHAQKNPEPEEKSKPKKESTAQETKPTTATQTTGSQYVKRATFTSSIEEREPVDKVESLTTEVDKVFFFTEIVEMEGKTITHRWTHDGDVIAEVSFDIGGPRWRVYSSKKLVPGWVGTWKVTVVDDAGNELHEDSFAYVVASAQ